MRTTLDLPDAIFLQLEAESALRGLALKDLVTEFIQAGLQRANPVGGPRLRSPLPVIRKPRGVAHPALSNREIEELLTESDASDQS